MEEDEQHAWMKDEQEACIVKQARLKDEEEEEDLRLKAEEEV